ncbi:hypothetical protein Hanom_Chr09g00788111 [Helianthus anomalus]
MLCFIMKHEIILIYVFFNNLSVSITYIFVFITRTFYLTYRITMHVDPLTNNYIIRKCKVQKQIYIVVVFLKMFLHDLEVSYRKHIRRTLIQFLGAFFFWISSLSNVKSFP